MEHWDLQDLLVQMVLLVTEVFLVCLDQLVLWDQEGLLDLRVRGEMLVPLARKVRPDLLDPKDHLDL